MLNDQKCISLKACFALFFYLIIPSIAIIMIIGSYPELSKDRFYTMLQWILPTSIAIVFLAQCSLFYQKGDFKYYLINVGFIIATMIWVYGLLGGGLIITNQWDEYLFNINMTKYVMLIMSVTTINIIYYTLEWKFYSKEVQSLIKPINIENNKKKLYQDAVYYHLLRNGRSRFYAKIFALFIL